MIKIKKYTEFQEKITRLETSLENCESNFELEAVKTNLNGLLKEYRDLQDLINKNIDETFNRITTRLHSLKKTYYQKKESLAPKNDADELPKSTLDRDPPLPENAVQAIKDNNKVLLLKILYDYCTEKFSAQEPPGFVSLKMIDAIWEMGTRGPELADLLKQALSDHDKGRDEVSQARFIAIKNTTSLIYQRFWNSGDLSIECYAIEGVKEQSREWQGFGDPLLSSKHSFSKLSKNQSLLFNQRGQLRKIISSRILDPHAEKLTSTPTVFVTTEEVWTDESGQSQKERCFGMTGGRFWQRWLNKNQNENTLDDLSQASVKELTDRHGAGW